MKYWIEFLIEGGATAWTYQYATLLKWCADADRDGIKYRTWETAR